MLGNLVRRHQDFHAVNLPSVHFPESLSCKGLHRFTFFLGVSVACVDISTAFSDTRKESNIREGSVTSLVELLGTSLQLLLGSLRWHVWSGKII